MGHAYVKYIWGGVAGGEGNWGVFIMIIDTRYSYTCLASTGPLKYRW